MREKTMTRSRPAYTLLTILKGFDGLLFFKWRGTEFPLSWAWKKLDRYQPGITMYPLFSENEIQKWFEEERPPEMILEGFDEGRHNLGIILPQGIVAIHCNATKDPIASYLLQLLCQNHLHQDLGRLEDGDQGQFTFLFKIPPQLQKKFRGRPPDHEKLVMGIEVEIFYPGTLITMSGNPIYGSLSDLPWFLDPVWGKKGEKMLTPGRFVAKGKRFIPTGQAVEIIRDWQEAIGLSAELLWQTWSQDEAIKDQMSQLNQDYVKKGLQLRTDENPYPKQINDE